MRMFKNIFLLSSKKIIFVKNNLNFMKFGLFFSKATFVINQQYGYTIALVAWHEAVDLTNVEKVVTKISNTSYRRSLATRNAQLLCQVQSQQKPGCDESGLSLHSFDKIWHDRECQLLHANDLTNKYSCSGTPTFKSGSCRLIFS